MAFLLLSVFDANSILAESTEAFTFVAADLQQGQLFATVVSKCASYKKHVPSGGASLPPFHAREGNNITSFSAGRFHIIGF